MPCRRLRGPEAMIAASAALASARARSAVSGDEAVELAVERFDAAKAGFGELDRRQLARGDEAGRFGDGQEGELRHRYVFPGLESGGHEHMGRLIAVRPRRPEMRRSSGGHGHRPRSARA